ncbi:MAG: hypothetical protein KBD31_00625 [Proteobacteria bacterium]|nr:hypothetical protein [Pseudomonadota bacterium]
MLVHILKGEKVLPFLEKLSDFEKEFVYPSEDGVFELSHGKNYNQFFKTLRFNCDDPIFILVVDELQTILGVVVAVLQSIPTALKCEKAWYICDFKISKSVQNLSVIKLLLKTLKSVCHPISDKTFALSMNTKGKNNKIVNFSMNNPFSAFKSAGVGQIYYLKNNHELTMLKRMYPDSFLLQATDLKTIIMNGEKVDLWHFMPSKIGINNVFKDFKNVFMLGEDCGNFSFENRLVLANVNLIEDLSVFGSYSILQKGLDEMDWSYLTPFDI